MFKLMKYEFRKQLFSKFAIGGILVLLELYFFYGLIRDNGDTMGTAAGLLAVLALLAMFYVSFESIFTFSNDLKTKQSYMLFMTPQSAYSIMGAKVLSSIIQIALVAVFFGVVAVADVFAMAARKGEIKQLWEMAQELIRSLLDIEINFEILLMTVVELLLAWMMVVILGMLSITLSATFMANSKAKGVVSFVIFIGLNVLLSKASELISDGVLVDKKEFWLLMLFYAGVTAISYVVTAWMLEKKVSV